MTRPVVLVVGATGQLGTETVMQLLRADRHAVRALVRPGSASTHLQLPGVELVTGDLKDLDSLQAACSGVAAVVATATVVFPRGRYSFAQDELQGYRNLLRACADQGVARIAYVSLAIPFTDAYRRASPTYLCKAQTEALVREAPMDHAIVRCAPFMDDYFALMGSAVPLAGERAATLDRSTGATRLYRRLVGRSIDRWGVALVPGGADRRHAFVAVADVAACLLAAVDAPRGESATLELGGPQSLSWREVCGIYAALRGRRVRALRLPVPLLRALAWLSRPWSEAFSNQLAILWILGENETGALAGAAGEPPPRTSAQAYLAGKWREAA